MCNLFVNKKVKDGVVQLDAAIELGKKGFGSDAKTVEALKKTQETCGLLTDPDRCEAANKRFNCLRTEGPKHGLPTLSL